MTPTPHHFMPSFPTQHHELLVGGIRLSRLAQRIGSTPFYAYDRQLISERVQQLRYALPSELKIHYAIKANPMPAVVQHMATLVDGFDLASSGEMKTALDTTIPAENISMAGPGKRPTELMQAIAAGITVNIESSQELETLIQLSNQLGIAARVGIRVNPAFELKSSGMKMGGGSKPFGIDEESVPHVLHRIAATDLSFEGFHIYSGSQNLHAELLSDAQQQCFLLAQRLMTDCPLPLKKLNIGGGLGIPYFPGDKTLDIDKLGDLLTDALSVFKREYPKTNVIMELGRYLIGEAGIYVCRVVDKKISRGHTFLVVDGGLHHHLAASGNFGQVLRKNYPVVLGNKMETDVERELVTIVGPLCTPLDIVADKVNLPIAEIGDFVVVFQSGAYGFSASPTQFLSQPLCTEVLV